VGVVAGAKGVEHGMIKMGKINGAEKGSEVEFGRSRDVCALRGTFKSRKEKEKGGRSRMRWWRAC